MQDKAKKAKLDVEGEKYITDTLLELLNSCPILTSGEKITFADLKEDSGIAMVPVSGAAIETESEDILGHVTQICVYPFYIIYRTEPQAQNVRVDIKEFLDSLGRWLEGQSVVVNGEEQKLFKYPSLSKSRLIKEIKRDTPANLNTIYENNVQDWAIQLSLKYKNEFDKF